MPSCCSNDITKEFARNRCRNLILESIREKSETEETVLTIIDALPTLGKSRSTAGIIAPPYPSLSDDARFAFLTHRRKNRTETKNRIREVATSAGVQTEIQMAPILENDCPTARGEHGPGPQTALEHGRSRGIAPSYLHYESDLPCRHNCEYLERLDDLGNADIVIGHPSHAHLQKLIQNRIVFFDEGPSNAYRTELSSSEAKTAVSEFLSIIDETWASNFQDLFRIRNHEKFDRDRQEILEMINRTEYSEILELSTKAYNGRPEASTIIKAVLSEKFDTPSQVTETPEPARCFLSKDLEYANVGGSKTVVYDRSSGTFNIRNPPDLSEASCIIGLDGTPVKPIWAGQLGVDVTEKKRVLCEDCRQKYLTHFGYNIIQTTQNVKPYSSGNNVNQKKDMAFLQAVQDEAEVGVGIISSKKAIRALSGTYPLDSESEAGIPEEHRQHYGDIRSSNQFAGGHIGVGVVLGSPHPGDNELKILAALDGAELEIQREYGGDGRKKETIHTLKSTPLTAEPDLENPYLNHVRENEIVQAVFRFGREEGATVLVQTSAIPDWLCTEEPVDAIDRFRHEGEQNILRCMKTSESDLLSTSDIAHCADLHKSTVHRHLQKLREENEVRLINDGTGQGYFWQLKNSNIQLGARVGVSQILQN